jgi:hypothetical protein
MNQTWTEIRQRYTEAPEFIWTSDMLAIIDYISASGLSAGLYARTSMFDLHIAQAPVTHPIAGPYLCISPLRNGQIYFRYIDTMIKRDQWHRVAEKGEAAMRFRKFVQQLCWSTSPGQMA